MDLIIDNPELGHQLITWGFAALAVGLSAGVTWLCVKLGWQLSDRRKQQLNDAFMTAIAYWEEQTHKGLDKKGAEKLALAEQTARSLAPRAFKGISTDVAKVLLEAKLQSVRPLLPRTSSIRPVPISFPPPPALPVLQTPIPPRGKA